MRLKQRLFILLLSVTVLVTSQNKKEINRAQFSPFLSRTYYNFNFGAIEYPFTNQNLKSGYSAEVLQKNRFSGRFLLGYKIKEHLGLQFGVIRPAKWFKYRNVNDTKIDKSVWINIWSLSLKKSVPVNDKWSFYGELGVGNVTRVGFNVGKENVYSDAHYGSLVTGAGVSYKLNNYWDMLLSTTYLPKSDKQNQPYILQSTLGLLYNLRRTEARVAEIEANKTPYFFPKQFLQIGYANSSVGFLTNQFFSMQATVGDFDSFGLPIFWLGDVKAQHTLSVTYQKTAYHSRKLFSLDWGVSVTGFQTEATKTNVFAFSLFPTMRFYLARQKTFDFYMDYSLIGPTLLTKDNIDNLGTGPKLTYQDFMGAGAFFGKERQYNFELKIMHYSNGNIFNENAGVAIPLVFTIGKTL